MRIAKVLAGVLILLPPCGSSSLASDAVQIEVSIGPQLQAKADRYGGSELDYLVDALKADLQENASSLSGAARIAVVIDNAVPNRPTDFQLHRIPGLSRTAVALGGATITGSIRRTDGTSETVHYSWYEPDLQQHDSSGVWNAAKFAFLHIATDIGQGRSLDEGGAGPGPGAGDFGYPNLTHLAETQLAPLTVPGPAPFDAQLKYPPGSPEAYAQALGQQMARTGPVPWPPKRWPRAVGFDPALVARLDAGNYTEEERRNLLATAAYLTVHGPPRQAMPHTADDIGHRRGFAELEQVYGDNGYLFSGLPTDSIADRIDLVEDIMAKGDRVWVRWRIHGHHTGYIFGLPPDGRKMDLHEESITRFVNGRVAESEATGDDLALYLQAGGTLDLHTAPTSKAK